MLLICNTPTFTKCGLTWHHSLLYIYSKQLRTKTTVPTQLHLPKLVLFFWAGEHFSACKRTQPTLGCCLLWFWFYGHRSQRRSINRQEKRDQSWQNEKINTSSQQIVYLFAVCLGFWSGKKHQLNLQRKFRSSLCCLRGLYRNLSRVSRSVPAVPWVS